MDDMVDEEVGSPVLSPAKEKESAPEPEKTNQNDSAGHEADLASGRVRDVYSMDTASLVDHIMALLLEGSSEGIKVIQQVVRAGEEEQEESNANVEENQNTSNNSQGGADSSSSKQAPAPKRFFSARGKVKRNYALFQRLVDLIDSGELSGKLATECVNIIRDECDTLSLRYAVALIQDILNGFCLQSSSGEALQLLPKLLHLACGSGQEINCSLINLDNMSPKEFFEYVLMSLKKPVWPSVVMLKVISILAELPLTEDQQGDCLSKVQRNLNGLDPQQLPALTYQLLLFSLKGCRPRILRLILNHFASLDASVAFNARSGSDPHNNNRSSSSSSSNSSSRKGARHKAHRSEGGSASEAARLSRKQLLQIEGTVLLHFNFSAKQDPSLATELLKIAKLRQCQLNPFFVAVLFSIGRIQRYETKVTEFLSSYLQNYFKLEDKRVYNSWLEIGLSDGKVCCIFL